jgi:nucleotide-binding universal stress UspA family protein
VRRHLGPPPPLVERLGEIEEYALAGFGPGQFERRPTATRPIDVEDVAQTWPAIPSSAVTTMTPAKLDRILVPLDGSPDSEAALPLAGALIGSGGGHLTLATVTVDGDRTTAAVPADVAAGPESARGYLQRLAADLAGQPLSTDTVVRTGPVAQTIAGLADELAADAVVMSTHADPDRDGDWLGQVAGPVLRRLHRPVVLARPGSDLGADRLALNRIVVALDGSTFAERVLPYAYTLGSRFGAQIVVLSVPEVPPPERYGPLEDLVRGLREEAEQSAQQYLSRIVTMLRDHDLRARGIVAGSGPARTILAVTEMVDADMMMIATHGRGGLARLLVGSVAERVLKHADRPVFLLPIREPRDGSE